MIVEAKIRPNTDEYSITKPSQEGNLAITANIIVGERFRQRLVGKLIAKVIANTHPRMDDYSIYKRGRALKGLSNYFSARQLGKFIARIEEPVSKQKPVVRSLLNNMMSS